MSVIYKTIHITRPLLFGVIFSFLLQSPAQGQIISIDDTLFLGCNSTLHLIFDSQISYLDLSCPDKVAAKISPVRKNILALRAKEPFEGDRNLSVLLSQDKFCPYILRFEQEPRLSVKDCREKVSSSTKDTPEDAVIQNPPFKTLSNEISHLGVKDKQITLLCSRISKTANEGTSIELTLSNTSSESFQMGGILFTRKRNPKLRSYLSAESDITPTRIVGTLDCKEGEDSRIEAYFDKLPLRKDENLQITVFEKGNGRTLSFSIAQKEIDRIRKRTY